MYAVLYSTVLYTSVLNCIVQKSESKELPSIEIGTGDRSVMIDGEIPAFIIGPCVIEDENFIWKVAKKLVELSDKLNFPLIFLIRNF